ncbi:MAG: protein-(glutamine-N5) methyltransferase, release factor-specific, partial [Flavobacteriaceae bacterium]
MVLIDLHKKYRQTLKKSYSVAEIDDLFKRLIKGFFDWEPTLLGLEPQKQLAPQVIAQLEEALDRLAKHEPVQYIIGKAHFRDLLLDVDSSTLIPRPETEELVEWVISDYPPDAQLHIVDVGTGSGCIALT